MDLVILLILIVVISFFFKDFTKVVYFLGIVEIFFRLIHFLGDHLKIAEVNKVINDYIPASLTDILAHYSSGLLYEILLWLLFICFLLLEVHLVRYFFKR